jgi:hypothetical protein
VDELLLVTYWWATGGGVQDLGSAGPTGLTSLGRLTGLLASDLLLVQVLLMARVPVLEHAFGQDRLAAAAPAGRLHLVQPDARPHRLITWGYAAGELSRDAGELWDLTVDYPGMLLAVAGTACLVMVVVTSVKAARRRLRYESWHLLHLYAYLGVGPGPAAPAVDRAGVPRLARRTVFWWGLWIAARARCWSGGSGCRCGAALRTGCGSPRSCPRATASCRST